MAEYRVRFVAENGTSSGDGSSTAPFRLPSQALNNLGTLGGFNVNPGKVVIGEGDFTETATINISRNVDIEGIGTYGGGIGGTRWIRGHSGNFIVKDSSYTDWSHHIRIANLTIDGNKASQTAEADLLTIFRPGFNTMLERVNFKNASGWGLVIDQGSNNIHGFDLGFSGCGTSTGGGAIKMQTTTGGNGMFCGFWGTQIDASGVAPVLIDQTLAGRSIIIFDLPEFEAGSSSIHAACIRTNLGSAADNVNIIVNGLVSQTAGAAKDILQETGSSPAHWIVSNASGSAGDVVFNGLNEDFTDDNCGFRVFGNMGGGSARVGVGENTLFSRKSTSSPEGNETGYVGDVCMWRNASSTESAVWFKEVGNGTSTGWVGQ
jgi:hypothetical protein